MAGLSFLAPFESCFAKGQVTASANNQLHAGGLVGGSFSPVYRCYATGKVSGVSKSTSFTGGLAGYTEDVLFGCYANNEVYGFSETKAYVGGLVGYGMPAYIHSCYTVGGVSAVSYEFSCAGGIAGAMHSTISKMSKIYSSFAVGDVSAEGGESNAYGGGIVGSSIGYSVQWSACYYNTGQIVTVNGVAVLQITLAFRQRLGF